jgi:hypothetical protein
MRSQVGLTGERSGRRCAVTKGCMPRLETGQGIPSSTFTHGCGDVFHVPVSMILFIVGVLGCCPSLGRAADDLPAASEVIRRMVERARSIARDDQEPQYAYEKRALLEHLDSEGRTIKSEAKIYQVTLTAGFPLERLVRIQGRELSGEELRRQQRREERFRQRFTSINASNMVARKEAWLTPELLDRYQFVVKKRVTLNNRPALVLMFRPKSGRLQEKAIQDKLLNRMAGMVWIDEQDAEAAKLSVSLTESLSLGWFGMLGSLSQCDLSLERQRMPEGVWVNAQQALWIQCRKLASTMRFRATEVSCDLKKVAGKR